MKTLEELNAISSQVRRDIVRMVHAVNSGHPGASLGCTEFFVSLYFKVLQHNSKKFEMDGIGEDLFFFLMAIFLRFFIVCWLEVDILQ